MASNLTGCCLGGETPLGGGRPLGSTAFLALVNPKPPLQIESGIDPLPYPARLLYTYETRHQNPRELGPSANIAPLRRIRPGRPDEAHPRKSSPQATASRVRDALTIACLSTVDFRIQPP